MRWFAGHLHTDDHSNCASGGLTWVECIEQGEGRTKDGSSRNTNVQGSESVLSRGRQMLRGNISGTRVRRGHCPQSPGKRVILEGKRGQHCQKLISYLLMTYRIGQGTLVNPLLWPIWEKYLKRVDICICITDALCCTTEINTTL